MTQPELAAVLGIGLATVTRTERHGAAKRATLMAWALATGVSFEWLESGKLPHLDSNQKPADYRPARVIELAAARAARSSAGAA